MSTEAKRKGLYDVGFLYNYGRHIHQTVFLETLQLVMDGEIIVTDLLNVNLNLVFQRVG